MTFEVCNDDHSSCVPGVLHCLVHGYDGSVPAPVGFAWHDVMRADGQLYTALVKLLAEEWEPTRWWRTTLSDGTLWTETSDERELREHAERAPAGETVTFWRLMQTKQQTRWEQVP